MVPPLANDNMPLYLFEHPETGEVKEILLGMNDEKKFSQDGIEWRRVFTIPQASVDVRADPFSGKDFVHRTGNKKGSYGNILDEAHEASEKRKDKLGYDPIKKKYYEDWSKKRRGKKHPKAISEGY
jgi:hypothetical protein